jgi:hypothetical protein
LGQWACFDDKMMPASAATAVVAQAVLQAGSSRLASEKHSRQLAAHAAEMPMVLVVLLLVLKTPLRLLLLLLLLLLTVLHLAVHPQWGQRHTSLLGLHNKAQETRSRNTD